MGAALKKDQQKVIIQVALAGAPEKRRGKVDDEIIQSLLRQPDTVCVGRRQEKDIPPPHAVAALPNLIGASPLDNTGHLQIGVPMNFSAKIRTQGHIADLNEPLALFIKDFHAMHPKFKYCPLIAVYSMDLFCASKHN